MTPPVVHVEVGAPPRRDDDAAEVRPHDRECRSGAARSRSLPRGASVIGLGALAFSALYFLSDAIEMTQGGFSGAQLWLTLLAEAAVPIFIVGLAVVQRPRIGRLGEWSAFAYAYSYVFFTGSVVYALLNDIKDYATLSDRLGPLMVVHGAVMVIAGLAFGYAVLRARLLPAWTAVALMVGVILVAATQGLPAGVQLAAAGVRDLGFAGMGAALLRMPRLSQRPRGGDGGTPQRMDSQS
jgi:hypothetical protein